MLVEGNPVLDIRLTQLASLRQSVVVITNTRSVELCLRLVLFGMYKIKAFHRWLGNVYVCWDSSPYLVFT